MGRSNRLRFIRVVVERIPDASETPVRAPFEVVLDGAFDLDDGSLIVDLGSLALHEALVLHVSAD